MDNGSTAESCRTQRRYRSKIYKITTTGQTYAGGKLNMNKDVPWKDIILIVAIIYFLSPIDLVPGVLADDLAALGAALWPFLKKAMWL